MEKNKIITIRENLIREIEDKNVDLYDLADICETDWHDYFLYFREQHEEALNGAEIQRIFDYLNKLK